MDKQPVQVEKVVIPGKKPDKEFPDYGFVHFNDRSSAVKLVEECERSESPRQLEYPAGNKLQVGINGLLPFPAEYTCASCMTSSITTCPSILPTLLPTVGTSMLDGSTYLWEAPFHVPWLNVSCRSRWQGRKSMHSSNLEPSLAELQ